MFLVILFALAGVVYSIEPRDHKLKSHIQKIEEILQKTREMKQHYSSTQDFPRSCQDVKSRSKNSAYVNFIKPVLALDGFLAPCDMKTEGGGWTILLNRYDGSQSFALNWSDYKNGFGHFKGEFWLGLEKLYSLTGSEVNELLVELEDWEGKKVTARYANFATGSEDERYTLKLIDGYSGDAGDSLTLIHAGMKFSTPDPGYDCAAKCASKRNAGWWFNNCSNSALTQNYKKGDVGNYNSSIMYWGTFKGASYSLKKAKMMVRPAN